MEDESYLDYNPPVTKSEIDESSAQVINTIVLWRIYDTLLMILNELGGDAAALGRLHGAGQFIGPNPAVTLEEVDE